MPMAKQLTAIEIDDCKISELTADAGGAPTYATAIKVPNTVDLTVTPQLKTATNEGDAMVTGVYSKVTHVTGTVKFNSVPLDILTTLTGGTLTASGTTPNQTQILAIGAGSLPKCFKIQGRAVGVEGIDAAAAGLRVTVYKARLTGNPNISLNGNYVTFDCAFTAVRTMSDAKLLDITGEETKTVLA